MIKGEMKTNYTSLSQVLVSILTAPKTWILLTAAIFGAIFCANADAAETATQVTDEAKVEELWWIAKWFLMLPLSLLIVMSLIVNKQQGWGWVIVGMGMVLILGVAQFFWSILTSFRGDPAVDEDYFRPLESWASDSFDV